MHATNPLLDRLRRGPILADGAMGTQLYARGISFERCFDELNLSNPALVQEIHHDYLRAGAEMIGTNTFGANRFKLARHGLENKVRGINLRGVKIAREAREIAGTNAFVLGSVGPLGQFVVPLGVVAEADARAAFQEQIEALREGGADAVILETFSDLAELKIAIAAAHAVTRDLPLIAQMSFTEEEDTLAGNVPEEIAAVLRDLHNDTFTFHHRSTLPTMFPSSSTNWVRRLSADVAVRRRNTSPRCAARWVRCVRPRRRASSSLKNASPSRRKNRRQA